MAVHRDKRVTIDMVSERAGVSKTTISRFLNGKYEYMSEETRQRIQAAVDEMNYRPSPTARSLKNNKTGLIGLIVADITNPFSSILVKGVSDACAEKSYQLIIANTDDNPAKEREYLLSMIDRQVEGVILNTAGQSSDFITDLHRQGVVMALADRRMDNLLLDTVTTDNEKVTDELLRAVYAQGFTRVAFFSHTIRGSTSRQRRYRTFLSTSAEFVQRPERLAYIIGAGEHYDSYDAALAQCLRDNAGERLCVFTVNGVVLLGMLNEISARNLRIPDDIGVCGYDDWGWAGLVEGGISVISQPSYEVGRKAAELLIERISGPSRELSPRYIELASRICLRGSTRLKEEQPCNLNE